MQCPKCGSFHTINKGKREKDVQRYKCNDCGKWFCERTGKFYYRHRFPPIVMFITIMLCLVLKANLVSLLVKIIFRCKVDSKSILKWAQGFLAELPSAVPPVKSNEKVFLICHIDEKFIKVRGELAYIWNAVDEGGNWISTLVTYEHDAEAAEKFYKQLKTIYKQVDIVVTDGLQSYNKLNTLFGRRCKHMVAGLQPKMIMHKGHLLFMTNNHVECLHSHIEMFLGRFRHHFTNIESANRWMKGCMFITYLLRNFSLQQTLQHPPVPEICEEMIVGVEKCWPNRNAA